MLSSNQQKRDRQEAICKLSLFQSIPIIAAVYRAVLDPHSSVGGWTSIGPIKSANTSKKAYDIIKGLHECTISKEFTFPSTPDIRGCFGTAKKLKEIRGDKENGVVIIWRPDNFSVHLGSPTQEDLQQMIRNTISIFRHADWLEKPENAVVSQQAIALLSAQLH